MNGLESSELENLSSSPTDLTLGKTINANAFGVKYMADPISARQPGLSLIFSNYNYIVIGKYTRPKQKQRCVAISSTCSYKPSV